MNAFARDGFVKLPYEGRVAAWAVSAHRVALRLPEEPLRHGGTWRVGVDALPNGLDGSVAGVPLRGAWEEMVTMPDVLHNAQLSVVFPGYPKQDADESAAAHRFRLNRDAAHVDGLLPEGPARRRHLREPHAFVLGLPLNVATGSPLVVWRGSHAIVKRAFQGAFAGIAANDWGDTDVTDTYQAARRKVFETCERVELPALPGEATLLHRHVVHGVAPWGEGTAPPEGRMIAYFRPMVGETADWLGNEVS
ncbi:MAG: hypothetical protein AAFQ64_01195 [Pseudomonadota bacterium]